MAATALLVMTGLAGLGIALARFREQAQVQTLVAAGRDVERSKALEARKQVETARRKLAFALTDMHTNGVHALANLANLDDLGNPDFTELTATVPCGTAAGARAARPARTLRGRGTVRAPPPHPGRVPVPRRGLPQGLARLRDQGIRISKERVRRLTRSTVCRPRNGPVIPTARRPTTTRSSPIGLTNPGAPK